MNLIRVISTFLDDASSRVVKFYKMGKNVHSAKQAAPFGFDSNPIEGIVAIMSNTSVDGKPVVVGYINVNQLAAVGESRMFSLDEDGNLKFYIWCKNDGTVLIGGEAHNAVRYTPLNSAVQSFKDAIQQELVKIQTGIAGVGGAYTPGTLSIDLSDAKINEIKTP